MELKYITERIGEYFDAFNMLTYEQVDEILELQKTDPEKKMVKSG